MRLDAGFPLDHARYINTSTCRDAALWGEDAWLIASLVTCVHLWLACLHLAVASAFGIVVQLLTRTRIRRTGETCRCKLMRLLIWIFGLER
jgi:hypothetical protein